MFFLNFLSQQELLTKNASLKLLDLDWTPNEDWDRPFNARGFEIDLDANDCRFSSYRSDWHLSNGLLHLMQDADAYGAREIGVIK